MGRQQATAQPSSTSNHAAGFTVVELFIVMAIAGMILLIVLLAIPTLERNARNDRRRQDVATILRAVSQYELNDTGAFPNDCGGGAPHLCTDNSGGTTPNDYFLQYSKDKLVYYDNSSIVAKGQTTGAGGHTAPTGSAALNEVDIYNYEKCDPDTAGTATSAGAGYNDVVALYSLETTSVPAGHCTEL